jgi:hypothetical protein
MENDVFFSTLNFQTVETFMKVEPPVKLTSKFNVLVLSPAATKLENVTAQYLPNLLAGVCRVVRNATSNYPLVCNYVPL